MSSGISCHMLSASIGRFMNKKKEEKEKNAIQSDIIKIVLFYFEKRIPFSMP